MKRKYNTQIVNTLAKRYDVTTRYIRTCLKGEGNSLLADEIQNEYKRLVGKLNVVLDSLGIDR
ncbi:hypothetical protein ED312_14570 [Sinomicrobium pectinilyticum]|uniref:Transcriptional regulator n=1 Tax=Sinomicrobium pectinilyticum TaxID=1084421 RepID=A0A3N0E791_SINP1|nr:hypothetical protein ED312_14570 [Sinomicrobium pectinilyticum]